MHSFSFFTVVFSAVAGLELRTLPMLGTHCATELHPQRLTKSYAVFVYTFFFSGSRVGTQGHITTGSHPQLL